MTRGIPRTYSGSYCPSINKCHWPGFQGPLLVALFSSYPPLPNVLLWSNNFISEMQLVDVWCLVLALWFLSIFHFCFLCTQELLLQYCRITVGYSSSPFVRWVNFVSPNYLFFETMYYTGFSSVQSLSRVRLFATPWTAASPSITNSQSLLKLMSIKLVMPSNHLILCRPLLLLSSTFPSTRAFQMSQLFTSGIQSTGVSASASVLPMKTQDWSPLGLTGLTDLERLRQLLIVNFWDQTF